MSCEILLLVDVLVCEKNVSKDIVFGVLELVFVFVIKKCIYDEVDVCILIDCNIGSFEFFCCWQVVLDNEYVNEYLEVLLFEV